MGFTGNPSAGEPEDAAEEPAPDAPGSKRRYEQAQAWIGTLVGVVALGLSVYNLLALQREPTVDVALPHITRIAQGKDTWLYFQPTLSTRVKTERVEVITQIELELRPVTGGAKQPAFFWDETGSFSYDAAAHDLTYQRVADPSPLLVSQSAPQQPLLLFNAVGWGFAEGRYEGSLVLHRASGLAPLRKHLCLMVSKDAVSIMRKAAQYQFHDFRDDVPGTQAQLGLPNSCYVLSPV
ncbi:hypothetical protein [Streptomyces sp. NPDC090445]|uniref:hypothetical protein n=1 Tax=Streptomyces sp. NPDC090445 TaxID=3365963 RepID=UPI0037F2E840